MSKNDNMIARSFINAMVRAFDIGLDNTQSRVALVPFNAVVRQSSSFSDARATSAAEFVQYVNSFQFTRTSCPTCTNTAAAIASATSIIQARPVVEGRGMKTVAIFTTDGDPNNKAECENKTPLACTRTKFATLKDLVNTTIFVRIGNKASKTLFNNEESARIDTTFSNLAMKVETVLDSVCD